MLRPATTTPTIRSLPIRVLARAAWPAPPPRPCLDSALPRPLYRRASAAAAATAAFPSIACSCRAFSTVGPRRAATTGSPRIASEFFSSRRPSPHTNTAKSTIATPEGSSTSELLPHRRRKARRDAAAAAAAAAAPAGAATAEDISHPPDASSLLASHANSLPATSLRRRISAYLSLSKPRLTMLVVLSAMVPYALYPIPSFLSPTLVHPTAVAAETAAAHSSLLSPLTLFFLTTGTALCSASANSLNMLYEPFTDAKMSRTRNRPLVRNLVSRRGAVAFAVLTAGLGVSALYFGVNPTVSFLGASNIILYAGIYTPLKALTVVNTWAGALVGGIPPLMGWAAAAGESATGGSWRELLFASDGGSLGGWLFAALLFAWQFPHFMALSWPIRDEYRAAGLRMLAWTNPRRNARVALRYSLVFAPICVALCAAGVTEWSFAVTSAPVNAWLGWQAYRFWRHTGQQGSARGLFWASVWHLPAVMVLALVQKKGMWARVWRSVVGEVEDEGDWEDVYEDELVEFSPPAPKKGL